MAVLVAVVAVRALVALEDAWHAEIRYANYDCSSGVVCTMRPRATSWFVGGTGRRSQMRINQAGFRGEWPSGPRAPGVTRVAMFGSSPVFGLGVDDEETMPVRLAEALGRLAPGRRFEVVNFGLPENFFPSQLLTNQLFARGLEPDVAVFVQPNYRVGADMNQRLLQLAQSPVLRFLLGHRWGRPLVNRYQHLSMALSNQFSVEDLPALIHERLGPVLEDVQQHGLRVVYFDFEDTRPPAPELLVDALGAHVVDAGLSPESYRGSPWILDGDGHPSPAGHIHFANLLAPAVLEAAGR